MQQGVNRYRQQGVGQLDTSSFDRTGIAAEIASDVVPSSSNALPSTFSTSGPNDVSSMSARAFMDYNRRG
jgi:hypothetical protein